MLLVGVSYKFAFDAYQTPFKRMARGMEDLSEDGGVSKKVLRPGTGPVVPTGATVRCMCSMSLGLVMQLI